MEAIHKTPVHKFYTEMPEITNFRSLIMNIVYFPNILKIKIKVSG